MKTLVIYNEHCTNELSCTDKLIENGIQFSVIKLSDCQQELKDLVTDTPCIITTTINLQGQKIFNIDNGSVYAVSKLLEIAQSEDVDVYKQSETRIDEYINAEVARKIEEYKTLLGL